MSERQTFTVFYSWQSDLEGRANRSLIGDALAKAAKTLRADDTLHVEPVMDRDTAGRSRSPDIAATIFEKIEVVDAFVADVSFITPPTPDEPMMNGRDPCRLARAVNRSRTRSGSHANT